ncbi:hypothetical protein D3C75_692260 [compost metagenome]
MKLLPGHSVDIIKSAVGSRACVHINHAKLGPGVCAIAPNGGVIGQGSLAAGESQYAPSQFRSAFTLTGHGAFAHAIGDGVGHFLHPLRVGPFDLVQD